MNQDSKVTGANKLVAAGGLNVALPGDLIATNEYQVLRNVRFYGVSPLQSRPGITRLAGSPANAHTGKQVTDNQSIQENLVVGAGTSVYTARAPFASWSVVDSGYSGAPLAFVPFRPNQTPEPWIYTADSAKNAKINVGTLLTSYRQGIIPPNAPPTGVGGGTTPPTVNPFEFAILENGADSANWTVDGTNIQSVTGAGGSTDTTTAILYDSGTAPGFASVVIASPGAFYEAGEIVFTSGDGNNETLEIDSVYPGAVHTSTITSIAYDAGSSGPCTITLNASRPNIIANCAVQLGGTAEYVRVISVALTKDNLTSFRCVTINSHTVGNLVLGVFSFRANFQFLHFSGIAISFLSIIFQSGVMGPGQSWVGTAKNYAIAQDLSVIGGRPLQQTDVINLDILFATGTSKVINEVQLYFALDPSTTNPPNNAYFIALRSSDFAPITRASVAASTAGATTLTTTAVAIQRQITTTTPLAPITSTTQTIAKLQTQLAKVTQSAMAPASKVASLGRRLGALGAGPVISGGSPITPAGKKPKKKGSTTPTGPIVSPPISTGPPAGFGGLPPGGIGGGGPKGHLPTKAPPVPAYPPPTFGPPPSTAIPVGDSVWAQVQVPISQVVRVGTDNSLTWANFQGLYMVVQASNSSAANASGPQIELNSIWIGGTFGPSTSPTGAPEDTSGYLYREQYRSSVTGARSNPGPATRAMTFTNNQQVLLQLTGSSDPQVDSIDIARWGGTLTTWNVIGTVANSGTTSFTDSLPDTEVASLPLMSADLTCPWPVTDVPHSGVCNVAGTTVTAVTGIFNVNWDQGSEIIIAGIAQIIYRVLSSSVLEIVDSGATLTSVPYSLLDPVIIGQPLPCQWGPYGLGQFGSVMFAIEGVNGINPGWLYWSNPNDPDSAAETNVIEVTSPSEPLVDGCMFGGVPYVWSTARMFIILPQEFTDPSTGATSVVFLTEEVPNSKGLWVQRAQVVTPRGIVFLAADGVYITNGGEPRLLTGSLYPLFPHDGVVGAQPQGSPYLPVNMTATTALRLSFVDGRVEFAYTDTSAASHVAILNMQTEQPWWESIDDYSSAVAATFAGEGPAQHARYLLAAGGVYQSAGTSDAGTAINCEVRTRDDDRGDSRLNKRWCDMVIDANTNNVPVTLTMSFNNGSTVLATQVLQCAARTLDASTNMFDINSGSGQYGRNMRIDLAWASTTAAVYLYEWQPSYFPKGDVSKLRATEFDDLGYPGPKWIQGVRLRADTTRGGFQAPTTRTLFIQGDNGPGGSMVTNVTLASVLHNGECTVEYPNDANGWTPFIAHLVRILPSDSSQWILFDTPEWVFEPMPAAATQWQTEFTTHGLHGFQHLYAAQLAHYSTVNWTLTVNYDDGSNWEYPVTASGGTFAKTYFTLRPKKFKAVQYVITAPAPIRVVKDDMEVWVGEWGRSGEYAKIKPFGDQATVNGARL